MELDELISSKLLKNWPSFLICLGLFWILKNVIYKRSRGPQRFTLEEPDEEVEDLEDLEDELQPALEEKPHVAFVPGQNLNPNGAERFYQLIQGRRSIRSFRSDPKPDLSVIEDCIRAAGTAPSGAHTEPWTYCVVEDAELKQSIREIVEQEEFINYSQRMHQQWVTDLRPLQTNHVKEYLTDAPYLILIFKQTHGLSKTGKRKRHYYNEISTSISAGFLLCALQAAGLSTLVTTPLNCGPALRSLLKRPTNEKLLILLPVGYPKIDCTVPDLERKNLSDIMVTF
ncbi:iodotyrosine deiodinase isoform X1 [Drosophila takahashii]